MSVGPQPGGRDPRTLGLACAALVASAAALWGASQAVWYRVAATLPERGEQVVEFTGAQVRPSLGGVALVALAGVAGVVATAGLLRRGVGVLLATAGVVVVGVGVLGLVDAPFAADGAASSLPAAPAGVPIDALRDQPTETTPAPLLAVLGGLLLVGVGVAVLLREPRMPRLGSRYAAGRTGDAARPVPADPDRAAWQDLDAGLDPTDPGPEQTDPDQPGERRAGTDGGPRNGAG